MKAILLALRRLLGADSDDYVSEVTLAHYRRLELRQGWDREAEHCGPWLGRLVTDAARTLRWVNK